MNSNEVFHRTFYKVILGRECTWLRKQGFSSEHLWVQKVETNSITAGRVWVSPRLNLRLRNDKVLFLGPKMNNTIDY